MSWARVQPAATAIMNTVMMTFFILASTSDASELYVRSADLLNGPWALDDRSEPLWICARRQVCDWARDPLARDQRPSFVWCFTLVPACLAGLRSRRVG